MSIRNIPNPPKLKQAVNASMTVGNDKIPDVKETGYPKSAAHSASGNSPATKNPVRRQPSNGGGKKNFSPKARSSAALQSEKSKNDPKKYRVFSIAILLTAACISFYFLSESAQTILLKRSFLAEAVLDMAIAVGFVLKFSPFQFLRFKSFAAAGFFAYVSHSLGIPLLPPVVLSILTGLLTFNLHKAVFPVLWLAAFGSVILLFLKI